MNRVQERRQAFENVYKQELELLYRVKARRNRLFGIWVAQHVGFSETDAQKFANKFVEDKFMSDSDDVLKAVKNFLDDHDVNISDRAVEKKFNECFHTARDQVFQEDNIYY